MTPEMMLAMPRSITLLSTPKTTMENLPPNLVRYIQTGWGERDIKSDDSTNRKLPRTLTEIPSSWKCLPYETWGNLPSSLRTLELPSGVEPTASHMSQLPPTLTKFTAQMVKSEWFCGLPSACLVRLQVRIAHMNTAFWYTVSQMNQLRAFSADSYGDNPDPPTPLLNWEAKLTHFQLGSKNSLSELGDWLDRPWTRALRVLTLQLRGPSSPAPSEDFAKALPATLHHLRLELHLDFRSAFPSQSVQDLPRGLRTIFINPIGVVSSTVLQALPRTLAVCDLLSPFQATYTRDDVFTYLPRTLTKFLLPASVNFHDSDDMTPYLSHFPLLRDQASIFGTTWNRSSRADYKRAGRTFDIIGFLPWAIAGSSAANPFPFYPPYDPATDPLPTLLPTKVCPGSKRGD
jgi:hypothetical protein